MATGNTHDAKVESDAPLFCWEAASLRLEGHRGKTVKSTNSFDFGVDVIAVPLMAGRFSHTLEHHPNVLVDSPYPQRLAVLGLEDERNRLGALDRFSWAGTLAPGPPSAPFISNEIANSVEGPR